MVLETILLFSGGAASFCYWYFWNRKYQSIERNIRNYHIQVPPRYDDSIPLRNTTPAPPYQESVTPPPPIDPPQY